MTAINNLNSQLKDALAMVVEGVTDPLKHYIINANYYLSEGKKVYIAAIYMHKDSCWEAELGEDVFSCKVLLNRHEPEKKSLIEIPYSEIWAVLENDGPVFNPGKQLFYDRDVLSRLTFKR